MLTDFIKCCIGFEISPDYCRIASARLSEACEED